jgi:hypothetical protein
MSEYTPDRWLVLRIHTTKEILYRVFATWYGGYGGSDSWQLNSGIVSAQLVNSRWEFSGLSGSVYSCHTDAYGTNGYGGSVLSNMISQAQAQDIQVKVMERETNWAQLQYDTLAQWVESGVGHA